MSEWEAFIIFNKPEKALIVFDDVKYVTRINSWVSDCASCLQKKCDFIFYNAPWFDTEQYTVHLITSEQKVKYGEYFANQVLTYNNRKKSDMMRWYASQKIKQHFVEHPESNLTERHPHGKRGNYHTKKSQVKEEIKKFIFENGYPPYNESFMYDYGIRTNSTYNKYIIESLAELREEHMNDDDVLIFDTITEYYNHIEALDEIKKK